MNVDTRRLVKHGRDCADALAFDAFASNCVTFREEILPLREAAENDEASYDEYDEAYNVWLEDIHHSIVMHLVSTGRIDAIANRMF